MNLYTIDTGYFKLDGGAMFGVVPRVLWERLNPPDEKNLCTWALRCLLVETENHLILIDNGIGDKQSEKFFSHFEPHGDDSIEGSLKKHGFTPDDITDNFITHLHFDHCGGGIVWNKVRTGYEPRFKNATYHVSLRQWDSAMNPNIQEKASFLKENIIPMKESGQLNLADSGMEGKELFPGFTFRFANGHTHGMMIPVIQYKDTTLAYMADLLPSTYHFKSSYIMAYDVQPLISMVEKPSFLEEAYQNNYVLFFEHDPKVECCNLIKTKNGVMADKTFNLSHITG